jgi:O-antigen ligase
VRTLRLPLPAADFVLPAGAGLFTLVAAYLSVRMGAHIGFGLVLFMTFFAACVFGFLLTPHWMVALMIPVFALIPAAKVLVTPTIGPLKDVVTVAAIVATVAVLVLEPSKERRRALPDRRVLLTVGLLLGLYVVNVGGGHGVAWAQGLRLTAEPLLLLIAGLTLPNPRKTLRFAVVSLVATACGTAVYGLVQQAVGKWTLVGWGYSFSSQVRSYNGHLRSFSTFDDPFAYAAFVLFAIAALLFWTRRGVLPLACGSLLLVGLAVSYVRTAALIAASLAGLWLARKGFAPSSVLVMAAAIAAMVSILFTGAGATQTQSYQSGNSSLTLNGRTSAWKAALGPPTGWPFGRGVGEVGTAAYRTTYTLVAGPHVRPRSRAVDSGYLATIADVGLVGLAVLLALFGRLIRLGLAGMRRGHKASWLAVAMLIVLMLDAITRSSFTGFPTAFLGLLIVGVALAASAEADRATARAAVHAPR